ncbi:hypothetical protein [Actinoplanes sp. GCM10030250]|uniref:hypothetical protein n=1 Tax=Actinoplanes sp. GCM10030250 TaxID=3273376 RepID=UPI00360E292C
MDEPLDARIARLAAALRDREQLEPRRAGLVAAITRVTDELAALRREQAAEQRHVDRLEGFSVDRVLTTLRGTHGSALDRERAEAEQARSRTADAQRRLDSLTAELAAVKARLAATSTAPATYAAAIAEKERQLRESGHASGTRLTELAVERDAVRSDLQRLQRAAKAAARAAEALRAANEYLASAGTWSIADTFLSGGVLSSYVKHERMDEASAHLAGAERQLDALRKELGDRGAVSALGTGPGVDETTRFFDVWLDNIFTDLSVRGRIDAGRERIARVAVQVRDVRTSLNSRIASVRARLRYIEGERERLLSA